MIGPLESGVSNWSAHPECKRDELLLRSDKFRSVVTN